MALTIEEMRMARAPKKKGYKPNEITHVILDKRDADRFTGLREEVLAVYE